MAAAKWSMGKSASGGFGAASCAGAGARASGRRRRQAGNFIGTYSYHSERAWKQADAQKGWMRDLYREAERSNLHTAIRRPLTVRRDAEDVGGLVRRRGSGEGEMKSVGLRCEPDVFRRAEKLHAADGCRQVRVSAIKSVDEQGSIGWASRELLRRECCRRAKW